MVSLKSKPLKYCVLAIFALLFTVVFYFGYVCSGMSCSQLTTPTPVQRYFTSRDIVSRNNDNFTFILTNADLDKRFKFDMNGEDVIVFLHIQKTGGSGLGRHLVRNIDLDTPCDCNTDKRKRCFCETKDKHTWIFSRYSTGWMCGLHADWTELKNCVDSAMNQREKKIRPRRYHYITILRNPVSRFISEWMHVARGATWKTTSLKCNGRSASLKEVPFCYEEPDWYGVTIDEFIACPHNLAHNRQTRMLANLSLVNCYNTSGMTLQQRNSILLASAKENLLNMTFVGITEFQVYTQQLFEYTFNLEFINDFVQYNVTHISSIHLSKKQYKMVQAANSLDLELYLYAKELFLRRYHAMKMKSNFTKSTDSDENYYRYETKRKSSIIEIHREPDDYEEDYEDDDSSEEQTEKRR